MNCKLTSFAGTGRSVNLMTKNKPLPVDSLVHELYTRYILSRDNTGYYYKIDDTYQGNLDINGNTITEKNNVVNSNNEIIVNLYQIQVI